MKPKKSAQSADLETAADQKASAKNVKTKKTDKPKQARTPQAGGPRLTSGPGKN